MEHEINQDVIWPFWLELAFFVFIPIIIWCSVTPTNVLNATVYGRALEAVGLLGGKLHFFGGIPVGIVGLVNAKKMGRRRGITRVLSVLNLCAGLLMIGSVVLVFLAVIFGDSPT